MANAVKWITNVGKSISYSLIDELKASNETLASLGSTGKDAYSSIYTTIKNGSGNFKDIGKTISENKYVKIGKDAIENLKSDLKTGKLYNKERLNSIDPMSSMGFDDINFDDSDFGFFDDNGSDDLINFDDDIESAIISSSNKSNQVVDMVGEKSSKAISSTIITTSEYIADVNKASTKALYDQNNALFGRLHSDMKTMNDNLNKYMSFSKDAMVGHYNQSSQFYQNTERKLDEITSLLKESLEISKKYFSTEGDQKSSSSANNRYSDIVDANGLPNFAAYFDLIKKNSKTTLSNNTYGMIDMADMLMPILLEGAASPGKFATTAIAKLITPKALKSATESLNNTLSNVFSNFLLGIDKEKGGFIPTIKGIIADIFGVDTSVKTGINTSLYKKEAIPFDGVTKKAIIEVIPTYLSKILAAVSNTNETRYDYDKGQFISMKDLRKEFKDMNRSNVQAATYDMRDAMLEMAKSIKFDKSEMGNFLTRDQFVKDLNAFLETQYKNARVFNGNRETIDPSTYGMKGGKKSELSAKIIQDMWRQLPRRVQMELAGNILNQRDAHNRQMKNLEETGAGALISLFNGSTKAFGGKANSVIKSSVAEYNDRVIKLLTDIRKEVSYIRTYGFSGGKSSSKTTTSKSSKKIPFKNFSAYDDEIEPLKESDETLVQETGYFGYEDPSKQVDRLPGESNEAYMERVKESYKAKETATKKKGLFTRLFNTVSRKDAAKTIGENIDEILHKPVQFLTTVIQKADQSVYDLIFGKKDTKERGILHSIKTGIQNTFEKFGNWMDEHILEPLSKKLTKENIHNAARSLFKIFGLDFDEITTKLRTTLFGEKGEDGKRLDDKKGLFGGFIDGMKESFKGAFGWVKDAFKETFRWFDDDQIKDKRKFVTPEMRRREKAASKFHPEAQSDPVLRRAEAHAMYNALFGGEEEPEAYARGIKRVPKTGIYALSEGEAVIPPDRNPYNIQKRYRNERRAINRFKKYGGINMLAEGTDDHILTRREAILQGMTDEEYDAYLDKQRGRRFRRGVADSAADLVRLGKRAASDIAGKIRDSVEEKKQKIEMSNLIESLTSDVKEYFPTLTTGALIGSGVSLVTGMIGGPLVGAAVGAGVSLGIKSKAFQKILFGEWDEEKQSYKDGGLLGKDISNNVRKYFPNMAKGATVGAITSIMPFVPGGPLAGIMVGSAIGFASKNEKIQETLFGAEGKLKELPDYLKKSLPRMGLGALLGALTGPFGLGANLMLGSAIGFAADTNKFKDIFFGEKDEETGKRHGGIYGAFVDTVAGPLKEFVKENMEWFGKWFRETVKDNLTDFFKPVRDRLESLGENILDFFKEQVHDKIVTPIADRLKSVFDTIFKPFKFLFRTARNATGYVVGAPFRALGSIGRRMTRKDIRLGRTRHMSAEERLEYRRTHNMGLRRDRAYDTDTAIYEMAQNDPGALDQISELLGTYRSGRLGATDVVNQNTKKLSRSFAKNTTSLSSSAKKRLRKEINKGNFDRARGLLNSINMNPAEREALLEELETSGQKVKNAKEALEKFKNKGAYEQEIRDTLAEHGITGNLRFKDIERMINLERDILGRDYKPDKGVKGEGSEEHKEIVNKFDEIIEKLRILNAALTGSDYDSYKDFNADMRKEAKENTDEKEYKKGENIGDKLYKKEEKKEEKAKRKAGRPRLSERFANFKKGLSNKYIKFQHFLKGQDFSMLDEDSRDATQSMYESLFGGEEFADDSQDIKDDAKDAVKSVQEKATEAVDKVTGTVKEAIGDKKEEEENQTESHVTEDGTVMKYYRDTKGDLHPDRSDSETVQALKEKKEKEGIFSKILDGITSIPGKIISFFGGKKDDDKENENLFSKILKIAGIAMIAAALAPKLYEFGTKVLAPLLDKLWDKIKITFGELKDGVVEGFSGIADGQGTIANKIGEEIGKGGRFITDWLSGTGQFENEGLPKVLNTATTYITDWMSGEGKFKGGGLPYITNNYIIPAVGSAMEWITSVAIPKLAELLITNIPVIMKGILKGLTNLFNGLLSGLTHGILGSKEHDSMYSSTAEGITDGNVDLAKGVKIESLKTPSGTSNSKYKPDSSTWALKGTSTNIVNAAIDTSSIQSMINNADVSSGTQNALNTTSNGLSGTSTTPGSTTSSSNYVLGRSTMTSITDKVGSVTGNKVSLTNIANATGMTIENTKAYEKTDSARINKYRDELNSILGEVVEYDVDGVRKQSTVYDLLNSDEVVGYAVYYAYTDNQQNIPIKGYEILNEPYVAEAILGINTALTDKEIEELEKERGYQNSKNGIGILDPLTKDPRGRIVNRAIKEGLTGIGYGKGAQKLSKYASKQASKGTRKLLKLNPLGIINYAKAGLAKTGSIALNLGNKVADTILPESLIGSERKANSLLNTGPIKFIKNIASDGLESALKQTKIGQLATNISENGLGKVLSSGLKKTGHNILDTLTSAGIGKFIKTTVNEGIGTAIKDSFNSSLLGKAINKGKGIAGKAKNLLSKAGKGAVDTAGDVAGEVVEKATGSASKIKSAAEGVTKKAKNGLIEKLVNFMSDSIEKIFKDSKLKNKVKETLEMTAKNSDELIEQAGKKIAKEAAEEATEHLAKKGAAKLAATVSKFIASKAFIIAWLFGSFMYGLADAHSICQILPEDVTPQIRVIAAIFAMINETFGFLPTDILFNIIINAMSFITGDDVLGLDELQVKAQTTLSRKQKENGGVEYTLDDYVRDYNKEQANKPDYRLSQLQSSINTGMSGTLYKQIEKYIQNGYSGSMSYVDSSGAAMKFTEEDVKKYEELLAHNKETNGNRYAGIETFGKISGSKAEGDLSISKSGLYALSEGEYVADKKTMFGFIKDLIGSKAKSVKNKLKDGFNIKDIVSGLAENVSNIFNNKEDSSSKKSINLFNSPVKLLSALANVMFGSSEKLEESVVDAMKSLSAQMKYTDQIIESGNTNKEQYFKISNSNKFGSDLAGRLANAMSNIYKTSVMPLALVDNMINNMNSLSANVMNKAKNSYNKATSSASSLRSSSSSSGTTSIVDDALANVELDEDKIKYIKQYIANGESGTKVFQNADGTVTHITNAEIEAYKKQMNGGTSTSSDDDEEDQGSGSGVTSILTNPDFDIHTPAITGSYRGMNVKDKVLKPLDASISRNLSSKVTPVQNNFVSQASNTTRFNTQFDTTRQTVSDAGCAPAVATMVINSLRGGNAISMKQATSDALLYKVPNSGVTSQFFDDEFARYGIATKYIKNDKKNETKGIISKALKSRTPTILLGQDSSNRASKSKSPFGPNPHYVVSSGLSSDGKYINISDPEQKVPSSRYKLSDLLPKIKVAITTRLGKGKVVNTNKTAFVGGSRNPVEPVNGDYIGGYVKFFESGDNGPMTFGSDGYDGGGSFGSYQMIYAFNGSPGPAQTFWSKYWAPKYGACTSVADLKAKWTQAIQENGEDVFFASEWDYMVGQFYKPFMAEIEGVFDPNHYSRAMQECCWSWSVHKGPWTAAKELKAVAAQFNNDMMNADETELINACYNYRAGTLINSPSHLDRVVATGRYGTGSNSERALLLGMVGQNPITYTAPDGSKTMHGVGSEGVQTSDQTTESKSSIIDILFNPFMKLAEAWGLTSTGSTSSSSSSGGDGSSDFYDDGTISGPVSSDPAIAEKQVAIVAKMKGEVGKHVYGQGNAKYPATRDVEAGGGDCSSMVQWAYNKVTGVDVGSWSGGQYSSPNTYIVEEPKMSAKPDENKLQLADILLYGNNASSHAEIYAGNGQVLSHGNPSVKGPNFAALDRRNDYWCAKRLNDFKSSGTTMHNSTSSDTDTDATTEEGSGSGLKGSFVSQLDPRYANKRFNVRGDNIKQTIGDTGCAPASAAMVLGDIIGSGSLMDQASKVALGYKQSNSGVSADYFSDIFGKNGLSTKYYGNSSGVMSDLSKGKDVVLLGQDRKNRSKSKSPFGPKPHYVVASGLSKNGKNMTIKDPESNRPKQYSTDKILGSTRLGIGYGSGLLGKIRRFVGGATVNLPGSSNREKIWNYLRSKDVSEECSAGIIGNLMQESSCRPEAVQPGGPGRGICQWTYGTERWTGLLDVANSYGVDWTDLYSQCEWMWKEIQSENSWIGRINNKGGLEKFLSSNDITWCTETFCNDFERAGTAMMDNRIKYANEAYQEFTGRSAPVGDATSDSTGSETVEESEPSFIDSMLQIGDMLAEAYGLTQTTTSSSSSGSSSSSSSGGTGGTFPTYSLTDDQINDVATGITGETGGTDLFAAKQEASQMANLNEVTFKRSNTGDDLHNTLHNSGWYNQASWTRGMTDISKQAVQDVLVNGKRTLPRYVTEHDMFPGDIENPKERSEYKKGDPVRNKNGSSYKFYDFFGKNKDGDISGYFDKDYETYKDDKPWGAGSGLLSGRASGLNNTMYSSKNNSSLNNILRSTISTTTTGTTTSTSSKSGNVEHLIRTVIKLLAEIVTNTGDLRGIVELLSKIVELQGSTTEAIDDSKKREITNLKSRLSKTLTNYNVSNSSASKLSSLMESIENLAME